MVWFPSIQVEFDEKEYDRINAIISREKEKIPLEKEVMCHGGVELWLGNLLTQAKSSLAAVISNVHAYLSEPEFNILDMFANFPAQVKLIDL